MAVLANAAIQRLAILCDAVRDSIPSFDPALTARTLSLRIPFQLSGNEASQPSCTGDLFRISDCFQLPDHYFVQLMPSSSPTDHDPIVQIPRSFFRLFFIKHVANFGAQSGAVGLKIKTDGTDEEKDDDGGDRDEVCMGGLGQTVYVRHVEPLNGQKLLVFLEIIDS